jgi:hypothetical protein
MQYFTAFYLIKKSWGQHLTVPPVLVVVFIRLFRGTETGIPDWLLSVFARTLAHYYRPSIVLYILFPTVGYLTAHRPTSLCSPVGLL